ncbi:MAG: ABC transporter [Propionibacteriaceae bacterium]|nr:ABC transporter [Propionibacteriaceae bacterium]
MGETLSALLALLRDSLFQVQLSLPLPGSAETKDWADKAISQLDDYIRPRLNTIEAPVLAVVGGSTGAGKSTLVNSLMGRLLSTPGVIRPTTKTPVLIYHPADARWFDSGRILPELTRTTEPSHTVHSLQVVSSMALPEGLAILDAPDIDSVDAENRNLAAQLLSAADLWLFVTSAARYADAVPWEYLNEAAERSTALGVVVDRVPPAAMSAVPEHLARMMTDRGLGESPLFAVPETVTDSQGLLPLAAVEPVRSWLNYLAANQITRAKVVMGTLNGAIAAMEKGIGNVAGHVFAQTEALDQLRSDAKTIFAQAGKSVRAQSGDGTLLRGEVMARWQDFVGTGEFMRSVESRMGRVRDRLGRLLRGEPDKSLDVKVAVKSGLESLIIEAGQAAADRVASVWMTSPAGRYVIEWSGEDVGTVSADFPAQVASAIRRWQEDVLAIVTHEGADKRTKARLAALGVNAAGVSVMLVVFAHTAGLTGAEIGVAGGTAMVAQKVLEVVFGDEAIRRLAATAEERLSEHVDEVLSAQVERILSMTVDRIPAESIDPAALIRVGAQIGQLREAEMRRLENSAIAETEAARTQPDTHAKKRQEGDKGA